MILSNEPIITGNVLQPLKLSHPAVYHISPLSDTSMMVVVVIVELEGVVRLPLKRIVDKK